MITLRMETDPNDRSTIFVRKPPKFDVRAMSNFGPARYLTSQGVWAFHVDHLESFERFARYNDLHIADDRRKAFVPNGTKTEGHECTDCGQPGSTTNPPNRCPACGVPWNPMTPSVIPDNTPERFTSCACGHEQTGRFPFCAACGSPMSYAAEIERQHMINAASAAIRHRPVPDRSVAEEQVMTGNETKHVPPKRRVCCGRFENEPHRETCYVRNQGSETPEPAPPSVLSSEDDEPDTLGEVAAGLFPDMPRSTPTDPPPPSASGETSTWTPGRIDDEDDDRPVWFDR